MYVGFFDVKNARDMVNIMREIEQHKGYALLELPGMLLFCIHYEQPVDQGVLRVIARKVINFNGVVALAISGLCEDTREVYHMQEVQELAGELASKFPRLLTMPNLYTESRRWLLCAEIMLNGGSIEVVAEREDLQSPDPLVGDRKQFLLRVELPDNARLEVQEAREMLEKENKEAAFLQ